MNCKDCFWKFDNECEHCYKWRNIMKAKQIKVKYLREDMDRLALIKNGDWIDLRTGVDVFMKKGDFQLIPLGVAMQLPENTEALLIPRSSTFKKYGIIQANSVGLIDESYCGEQDEWMLPAYATKDIVIPKNTRICQFRIQEHQPFVKIIEVEHLTGTNRGGFGSTGER